MEKDEVIEHFESIKLAMQKQFPTGKWQSADDPNVKGVFSIKFTGANKPEKMTVYHTGTTNFQGGPNNGAQLKSLRNPVCTKFVNLARKSLWH